VSQRQMQVEGREYSRTQHVKSGMGKSKKFKGGWSVAGRSRLEKMSTLKDPTEPKRFCSWKGGFHSPTFWRLQGEVDGWGVEKAEGWRERVRKSQAMCKNEGSFYPQDGYGSRGNSDMQKGRLRLRNLMVVLNSSQGGRSWGSPNERERVIKGKEFHDSNLKLIHRNSRGGWGKKKGFRGLQDRKREKKRKITWPWIYSLPAEVTGGCIGGGQASPSAELAPKNRGSQHPVILVTKCKKKPRWNPCKERMIYAKKNQKGKKRKISIVPRGAC